MREEKKKRKRRECVQKRDRSSRMNIQLAVHGVDSECIGEERVCRLARAHGRNSV